MSAGDGLGPLWLSLQHWLFQLPSPPLWLSQQWLFQLPLLLLQR